MSLLDNSIDDIIGLYNENKLKEGNVFRFKYYKDKRKFLIKVTFLNSDDIIVNAAYEDNINMEHTNISKLKNLIENIDLLFKDKFKPKFKILGPVIYGEGH